MKIDMYGQQIFNEDDLCNLMMGDPQAQAEHVLVDQPIRFAEILSIRNVPNLQVYKSSTLSVDAFDKANQDNWAMPNEYKTMDIAKWVLDQCKTEDELQRAGDELLKFHDRDMFVLLQYLKYLVDTMREHNIVWGVGRGSSVASFVLFLIGIHKINSLYYGLSIDEFLK